MLKQIAGRVKAKSSSSDTSPELHRLREAFAALQELMGASQEPEKKLLKV